MVASIGTDTLRAGVRVVGKVASNPSGIASTDLFGVAAASIVARSHDLITVIRDDLHIFTATSGAFPGFTMFQPLHAPHPPASAAGTSNSLTSIIGMHVGRGTLVEIALPGFGAAVAHNVDAQEFLGTLWGPPTPLSAAERPAGPRACSPWRSPPVSRRLSRAGGSPGRLGRGRLGRATAAAAEVSVSRCCAAACSASTCSAVGESCG